MTKRSTKRPRLIRCEIRYNAKQGAWYYREKIDGVWEPSYEGFPKLAFIRDTVQRLRQRIALVPACFSLRIYKRNGQYQDERSYGHDPRKSKG